MVDRADLRNAFLEKSGWGGVDYPLLAGDASFRKYYRLMRGSERVVLMDAPPPQEDVRPFVKIAEFLTDHGFSAPKVYAQDEEQGFLLLEDLGDDTYTNLLHKGADEQELYALATDVLIELHKNVDQLPEMPAYNEELLTTESLLLTDWWMKAALGDDAVTDDVRQSYMDAWQPSFKKLQEEKPVLVLRDYHVDNLLILDGREGHQACGLLDFQDAVSGSALYDLMSLLEDARRDIEPSLIDEMKKRYCAAFDGIDLDRFEESFAVLGAQRHAKVIGIFARLCMRDGKPIYLKHIPRVWRLFERSLQHPSLKEVKAWVDTNIPKNMRGIPACLME